MFRHQILLLLALILAVSALHADLEIQIKNTQQTVKLTAIILQERNYISLDDINAALGSITQVEYADFRIYLYLWGEQFVFLPEAAYYYFKNDVYSMHFPLLANGAVYCLPESFLLEQLPRHFPDQVTRKGRKLEVLKPKDKRVQRIVLDPGHGGKDPGAVGARGTREKDINLAVALKLKQMMEKELGVTVLMTRSDDRFVSLADRTKYANDNHADIFISIHTNASKTRSAKGLETYYLSTAITSEARAVEALENNVVELYEGKGEKQKYDDLAFILSDLSLTEHLENSNHLATFVHQNLVTGTRSCDRGIKQANFYVLRGAFMPSILIEMGFISNGEEELLLVNKEYQDRISRTIFEGIKRFKYRFDRIRSV